MSVEPPALTHRRTTAYSSVGGPMPSDGKARFHRRRDITAFRTVAVVAAICVGLSILIHVGPLDHTLGNRRFHVALEISDSLVLVFIAAVLLGRFRSDGSRRNLLMLTGAMVLAAKNLFFAGTAMVADVVPGDHPIVWATAVNGVLGSMMLAAAAVAPDQHGRVPGRTATRVLAIGFATVVAVTLGAVIARDFLPVAFDQFAEEVGALDPLSGHPLKILVDLVTGGFYAVAAVAFARMAERHDDEFVKWLSVGSAIASISFLNYAWIPSRFTELLYGGEILWIGAVIAFLYGAVREIANLEAALVRSAVREERKRVARDLHDGVVQELSYIASQTKWLIGRQLNVRPEEPLVRILDAVERALDESRGAIAALNREMDEPLPTAVGHAASDVAARVGATLHLDVGPVEVAGEWRDALIRVAREAVGNAVRHGHAREITLQLRGGDPVRMRVTDDGDGFDPDAPRSPQSFGLQSMRERTESLGGRFEISSSPGEGTTVDIVLPSLQPS